MLRRKPKYFEGIINPTLGKQLQCKGVNYKKQRNYMVKSNNQSKQEHFDSLNPFLDLKPFWKSCKPYFSKKHSFGDLKIALNENSENLTENMKIAKSFTSYFESVTDSLELFD